MTMHDTLQQVLMCPQIIHSASCLSFPLNLSAISACCTHSLCPAHSARQSCVAMCCSELQCATLSPHLFLFPDCSPLLKILTLLCTCARQRCVAECCRVLHCVAAWCNVLQTVAFFFLFMLAADTTASRPLLTVYMCNTQVRCSVLQCAAVCCIV